MRSEWRRMFLLRWAIQLLVVSFMTNSCSMLWKKVSTDLTAIFADILVTLLLFVVSQKSPLYKLQILIRTKLSPVITSRDPTRGPLHRLWKLCSWKVSLSCHSRSCGAAAASYVFSQGRRDVPVSTLDGQFTSSNTTDDLIVSVRYHDKLLPHVRHGLRQHIIHDVVFSAGCFWFWLTWQRSERLYFTVK